MEWHSDLGVLNVPGLEKVCTTEGPWTIEVFAKDSLGTISLAKTTFRVRVADPLPPAAAVIGK